MRISILGPWSVLFFALGILGVQLLQSLPARIWLAPMAIIAIPALYRSNAWRLFGMFILGSILAIVHADNVLKDRISNEYEGNDWTLKGRIENIPTYSKGMQRFEFLADSITPVPLSQMRLRLTWYQDFPRLQAGDYLRVVVKLRRPRGSSNPGGFDAERYALVHRIAAVGYVRQLVQRTANSSWGITRLRFHIINWINVTVDNVRVAALLKALAVGDQSALSQQDWMTFRNTGTSHLIAISGFHVGMVGAVGALAIGFCTWLFPGLTLRITRPQLQAVGVLSCAFTYSLLAGWSIPVQRTLWMILGFALCVMFRRFGSVLNSLAFAVFAILVIDPLAILSSGFWLSFLGVLCLIYGFSGRQSFGVISGFIRAQWLTLLVLFPITLFLFQQLSSVGFVANMVAVPWVSFVMLPLLLLAVSLSFWLPGAAVFLLKVAAFSAEFLYQFLDVLARWPWSQWTIAQPSSLALILAMCGVCLCLLPLILPLRFLGLILLLPTILPRIDRPNVHQFDLVVFDVGQGLSALIRTHKHTLLFDTGAMLSDEYNYGDAVVVPALYAEHIRQLDALVVSHNDNDHSGGAISVIKAQQPRRIFTGSDVHFGEPCVAGTHWQWDGVQFEFLHPTPFFPKLGNDNSCVLKVSAGTGSVLLTGDASQLIESRLIKNFGDELKSTLLVLGHHGSSSSSSNEFLDHVRPQVAIVSSGYRNRYGHPAIEVMKRLKDRAINIEQTTEGGQLMLRVDQQGRIIRQRRWREWAKHYWNE